MSTPETPSTSAWWVFEMTANLPPSKPWISQTSQSGFERSRRWEKMRPDQLAQLVVRARLRQRRVPHVVVDVEARVVDPERPAHLEARERRASGGSAARGRRRDSMCARELVVRGRRTLEDHERADVHVRRLLLLVEEGGVDRAQPVLVSLLGHVMNLPATIASVKLLGTVLALQVVLGLVLVVLVATDNLPFVDDEADGAPRARRPPDGRPLRLGRGLEAAARAGRAGAAPGRIGRPRGGSPGGCGDCCRTAASRRCRAACATWSGRVPRARARLHRGRRPLRHEGPARLRGRQRRRVRHRRRWSSWRGRSSAPRHTIKFILFDGEESPRGVPDSSFARRGLRGAKVAAPALPGRQGDGAARLRRRPPAQHAARGLVGRGPVARPARVGQGGRGGPPLPRRRARLDPRRPHPLHPAGGAVDRPDRLRLPLLAPPLRRPVAPSRSAAWT